MRDQIEKTNPRSADHRMLDLARRSALAEAAVGCSAFPSPLLPQRLDDLLQVILDLRALLLLLVELPLELVIGHPLFRRGDIRLARDDEEGEQALVGGGCFPRAEAL